MKQDSLSYRVFSAAVLYFIGTLFIFSIYRLYNQEYLVLSVYLVGMGIGGLVYKMIKRGKYLNRIVMPSLVLALVFGAFFWFKDGGSQGSGLIFFTFILIVTIVSPRKYSKLMLAVVIVVQAGLVWAELYLQDLPIWGESPNVTAMYVIGAFVNLSVVWMLKYNYDLKEEKIAEFNVGLRELHRLNLSQNTNLDDVLVDYLNSGSKLFNMEVGLIIEAKEKEDIIRNANVANLSIDDYKHVLAEIEQQGSTVFRARSSNNLSKKNIADEASGYFIGSPLLVNNSNYGVLLFYSQESSRKKFGEYEIEIIELMALNISHLISMRLWRDHHEVADKALQLSEKRFKSIYDYANVGICVCDMEGTIVMANRALQELLEFTEEELKQHTFYSISDSGDLDELSEDLRLYEQIILGEIDHYILEKRKTTKQGRQIYISKTVSTIRDENEQVRFTVMIADDITVKKANEEKINNLNKALELQVEKMDIANKELEAFSYSVSHDLRAPLRAIDGFSKIILEDHKDEFSEESKRLLNVIINNSGKMATLIDDLLTFSRISRKVAEFKPIDFNDLVSSIIEEQALDTQLFEIETLPEARGEKTLMKQLLSNLIGNAVKFSSKKENPKIEIGCSNKQDHYQFFVRDNGVGFNMAYYNKIFGVFQRLHTDTEFRGTGVGLAIVQKVIIKHNGKVWAESEEGKGTVFYFSLPK
ncbi:MAG: ATP-binding protein [Reichenbachiella sp.]|uniref:ATP-binding protein n=1 Tax=Reichenbachiella sp. TaxID=2184521 RepID=UPI0032974133